MTTHTPPQGGQYTPPPALLRRRPPPGSTSRPSLSASFSLNPGDSSMSDTSFALSPFKARPNRLSAVEQGGMGMTQMSPRTRSSLPRSAGGGPGPSTVAGRLAPDSEPRTRSRSRLGEETRIEDEDEDGEGSWNMIDSMRLWRHDAIVQHRYDTAAFWGDKILTWTGEDNDAFWLAQAHYLQGNYLRAERLLCDPLPPPCHPKGKGKGTDEGVNGMQEDGPGRRLVTTSLACRSLAAECLIAQEKYHEALEIVAESTAFREPGDASRPAADEGVKLYSTICYLRGILHMRLSSMAKAKESFVEALVLDVKNYDAFHQLVEGQLMKADEEWDFISNLAFAKQLKPEDAHFVRLMYLSKLRKDAHVAEIAAIRSELANTYALSDNADVLVGLADELFARYKWEECYVVTSKILKRIPGHAAALQLHLTCMHHIPRLHSSLFLLSHELVKDEPHSASTWYAVGLWYLSGKRWAEARRHFSKANLIDQRFAPAWIAFAHAFAWEGEHELAITAYSTAARLFPGSHLTYLFIGQQQLQLSNSVLADEYFTTAASLQPVDPLLLNELGVAAYDREDYRAAIDYFQRAIAGAGEIQASATAWAVTHCNLGHALRVTRHWPEARAAYASCIRLDPTNAVAYASQAMISQLEGDVRGAIRLYHSALALSPQDPVATVLLEMALSEQVELLRPTTLPGLPAAIAEEEMDPFAVPKGNPSFGPLPVEADPATLDEAGETSASISGVNMSLSVIQESVGGSSTPRRGLPSMRAGARSRFVDVTADESSMDIEED